MQRSLTLLMINLLLILVIVLAAYGLHSPRPLAAQSCSDEAELVEQTLDPGDSVAPDSTVTVAWTLLNSGDCTWSRSYRLIFVSGDRLDGPRTVRLRNAVEPGQSLTLSLELVAPELSAAGAVDSYSGTWRLRNEGGDSFGPDLTVSLQVVLAQAAEDAIATADVVLPEVLVFGGMGAGDDANAIAFCAVDGELPSEPTLLADQEGLEWRYTTLYVCSLPEGTEVLVEITDPEGNTFSNSYVEDAPTSGVDEEGNEYTGTVLQVYLTWLAQSPAGEWQIEVTAALSRRQSYTDEMTLLLPPPKVYEGESFAQIDNYPVAPIDPFIAARGCHYSYLPGQEMRVSGSFLPPEMGLVLGVYHNRLSLGYLVDKIEVVTDGDGTFVVPYHALTEAGMYNLVIMQEVVAEGFTNDGVEYDLGYGGDAAFGCFSVELIEEPEFPLRLAFASGELGASEIQVYDLVMGDGYYPTFTAGNCDTSDPTWWPDGEWVVYQSNCLETETEEGWIEWSAVEDYDLYASMIDFTYLIPEEEKVIRFTETPDLHETEADVNQDGLIVYRETPVGESLDEVGELRVLDAFEETDVSLGIFGRAPVWSPNGTRVAFMSDAEGSWQIYVYDLEDEEVSLVSDNCETHCRLPAWSPNGRQLIYHASVSLEDFTPTGLWIASLTGISKPRLFLSGEYGRPTWSSEGWIAFQGLDGIYRTTTDGEPTVERYMLSQELTSVWSPEWSH